LPKQLISDVARANKKA